MYMQNYMYLKWLKYQGKDEAWKGKEKGKRRGEGEDKEEEEEAEEEEKSREMSNHSCGRHGRSF